MPTVTICSLNCEWMNDWFTPDADPVVAFRPTLHPGWPYEYDRRGGAGFTEPIPLAAAVGQRIAVVVSDEGDGVTESEAVGQAGYTLREEKSEVRYRWVIERADGSVCFRLARKERRLAEEILHNLLHKLGCEEESRRDAA